MECETILNFSAIENTGILTTPLLMADCIKQSGNETLDEVEAANYILKEIWNRLRETHRLRVVK
jgi:hypothetical protein